jgi:hypothetical protein
MLKILIFKGIVYVCLEHMVKKLGIPFSRLVAFYLE